MKLTTAILLTIAPGAAPAIVAGIVNNQILLTLYNISDANDIANFLAQCAEETDGFTTLEESLFYTSTARLRQVWPARFPSDASAAPYVRQPQKLANLVYGGRLGNHNPNDGWNYRGSGDIDTTGYDNFRSVTLGSQMSGNLMDAINRPDVLRSHPGALVAACWFWKVNSISKLSAAGDIVAITKAVNGGLNGLDSRRVYFDRALRALKTDPILLEAPNANGWLRLGMKGPEILALQQQLQAKGYYKGGILDSEFGPATEDAVKHFQTDKGLQHDGVAGPATLKALTAPTVGPAVDPHLLPLSGPLQAAPVTTAPGGLAALAGMLLGLLAMLFRGKP